MTKLQEKLNVPLVQPVQQAQTAPKAEKPVDSPQEEKPSDAPKPSGSPIKRLPLKGMLGVGMLIGMGQRLVRAEDKTNPEVIKELNVLSQLPRLTAFIFTVFSLNGF